MKLKALAILMHFSSKVALIGITYLISVTKNLTYIHAGDIPTKTKAVTKLGVLLSPLVLVVQNIISNLTQWGLDNYDYIQLVLGAIIVDHILGTIKHIWKRTFSIKKNIVGILVKTGLVVAGGFLFEGLNHLTRESMVTEWLTITTRCIVFLYPAGSAFSNMSVLSGGKFPPIGWMNWLKQFQQNLTTKQLENIHQNPPNDEIDKEF